MTSARHFEDFTIGETWTSAPFPVTEEDIVRFACEYDPQPIHTDPGTAADSRFGSVIASGWQIAALSMRLFVEAGGYGDTPVVGLGIDELRWHRVVVPGDVLLVVREVVETRRSKSKPGYGIVRTRVMMKNQRDETVMSLVSTGQVPAREAA